MVARRRSAWDPPDSARPVGLPAEPRPSGGESGPRSVLLASRDPALVVRMRRVLRSCPDLVRLVGVVDPTVERTMFAWYGEADVSMVGSAELLQLVRKNNAAVQAMIEGSIVVSLMQERHLLDVVATLDATIGILFCECGVPLSADAVNLTIEGYVVVPEALLRRLLDDRPRLNIANGLSAPEKTVLACLGEALPNHAIAARTGLDEARVKSMITQLIRKLRVRNRTALAVFAARRGMAVREG